MSPARKPVRLHRISIGAALLAIAAAPFALAGPAQATTTANGCSVTPLAPVFAGVAGPPPVVKQIRYNVVLACAPGRTVEVQQMFFEDDAPPDPDDFTGTSINTWNPTGIITRGTTAPLSNTEAGPETIYQRVRFRVTPVGGVQSAWTPFESSGSLTITN